VASAIKSLKLKSAIANDLDVSNYTASASTLGYSVMKHVAAKNVKTLNSKASMIKIIVWK